MSIRFWFAAIRLMHHYSQILAARSGEEFVERKYKFVTKPSMKSSSQFLMR